MAELKMDFAKMAEGFTKTAKERGMFVCRWIPVSEGLPEDEEKEYWVCTDSGYQHTCRWTNENHFWQNLKTDWHWHWMDTLPYSKIIAWMPLPEPWKGEQDERMC